MLKKQECISELEKLGVEFNPDAHVATLNKLLENSNVSNVKLITELLENKDKLMINDESDVVAIVEGILPRGMDIRHPYTRYKLNIDNERILLSEQLVKKLFKKVVI